MLRKMVLLLIFLLILVGCAKYNNGVVEKIDMDEVKEIVLNDAKEFKPDYTEFGIYSIEQMEVKNSKSINNSNPWEVIISSKKPHSTAVQPNIYYKINALNGKILERENYAVPE